MSAPGWYPDPAGAPGRYRYWDGTRWSTETSDRPGPAPAPTRSRRGLGIAAGVIAVLVVVVLLLVFAVRSLTGARPITDPAPSSTVTGWDDSQPTASPTPTPAPTPPSSPTPSASESGGQVRCPEGDPAAVGNHPADDRVYGGRLSFPRIDSYGPVQPKYGLSWFYDVGSQSQTTEPGWESWFAVGEVAATEPGFGTPREAAEHSVQCSINHGWFSGFSGRTDLRNEKFSLDGHQGWIIVAEVRVDNDRISVEGDVVTIVVLDDGRDDRFSGYVSMVPIGDGPRNQIATETLKALRVG